MQATEAVQWKMEEWELPPPLPRTKTRAGMSICPYVGLKLPYYAREKHLKKAWFSRSEMRSWEIQPFRRRALYKLLKRNFSSWIDWLRIDSTPTFYKDMEGFKKRQSGAVIGIAGPKMSGKSRLGQMLLTRLVDTQPHVLFQYKDLEHHIKDRDNLSIAIQIDEDLKATGNESRNLVVHVNNSFETSRKADLWAICTGVNLSFKNWGDTLDLRMIPFGFNADFQATRAAIFDKESDFLGFCVFQRKHLPEDSVFYYNADGKWGEYEARARAYSLTVTKKGGAQDAVDDITQTKHVEILKRHFKVHYLDKGISMPSDLMCNRLYRQAKLPAKSSVYMKEIIAWAKFELEDEPAAGGRQGQGFPVPYIEITADGWFGLRADFEKLSGCWPCALYFVPPHPKASYADIVQHQGLPVLPDSLGKQIRIRRRLLPPLKVGKMAEDFVAAHIDSLSPRKGTGTKGQPDILIDTDGVECALNVKLSLEVSVRRDHPTTPENKWMPNAIAVLVLPRLLEIRLYPITGESTMLNSRKGVLCAPGTLAQTIKEMIVSEQ